MNGRVVKRLSAFCAVVAAVAMAVLVATPAQAVACGPAAPLRFSVYDNATSTGELLSVALDGSILSTVPFAINNLNDIAMRADGAGYWAIDWATGELKSIDATTGIATSTGFFGPGGANGLVLRPNGHLITDDGSAFYDMDPATGTVTALGMRLPTGWSVDGDYTVIPDGRLLVLAYDGTGSGLSQLVAFDLTTSSPTPVVIGTVPQSYAMVVFDGVVYLGTANGDLQSLSVFPTVPSSAPLPTTTIRNLSSDVFYGGAVLQPIACPTAAASSSSAATSSTSSAATTSTGAHLASTGVERAPLLVSALAFLLVGLALVLTDRGVRAAQAARLWKNLIASQ